MTELFTLSLRLSPAILRRKFISTVCIQDLILSVMIYILRPIGEGRNVDRTVNQELYFLSQLFLHHNRLKQLPFYCRRIPNMNVHLPLHPTITRTRNQSRISSRPWMHG
ncbi:hypothetical protein ATANTOWER_021039 [Ataeniobius toweri]|uniref:Uncharacterized protein n=1 Tax=Ataeniobius toweri TaxID=208326 RepID=A0ABU7BTY6_9TELE|nr:hypothetical protein [Ataeniobius toweri]